MSIGKDLLNSLNNNKDGFSARKLSAFVGVLVAVYTTVRYVNGGNLSETIIIWLSFALLCLGIITAEQLIKFKDAK